MPRKYIKKTNRAVNESNMKKAIKEHLKNNVHVRECARVYQVNRNTLVSRLKVIKLKGKEQFYVRETDSGMSSDEEDKKYQNKYTVNQVFSASQESKLVNYVLKCSTLHYGLSLKQIRLVAFDYARELVDCKYPPSWTENKIAGKFNSIFM